MKIYYVYTLYSLRYNAYYIGQTGSFHSRVHAHKQKLGELMVVILEPVANKKLALRVEEETIKRFCDKGIPLLNKVHNSRESIAIILKTAKFRKRTYPQGVRRKAVVIVQPKVEEVCMKCSYPLSMHDWRAHKPDSAVCKCACS